jgi:hypothetical protein
MTKLVFSMIEISVLIASFRLVLDVISLIHSRIRGNKSPKYGLIASALIFEISEMTVKIDDTIIEVDCDYSSCEIKLTIIYLRYGKI